MFGLFEEERREARARAALRKQYLEDARENERKAMPDFEVEKKGSDFEVRALPADYTDGEYKAYVELIRAKAMYGMSSPAYLSALKTFDEVMARGATRQQEDNFQRALRNLPPVYRPNPKLVIDPKPEGRKDDAAKDRFELLPGDALRAIAVILTFGAAKYGDRNWEKGMKWSRVYGALQRHLNDWWQGEALDAETGKSHLAHAGCCLLFLIAYEIRTVGEDDRPKARTSS